MSPLILFVLAPALSRHCVLRSQAAVASCSSPSHAAIASRTNPIRLQVDPIVDDISLTLTGCSGGIGVGLDNKNKVDMIKPNSPASRAFQEGDLVISWNGEDMMKVENGRSVQKKLRDVVEGGRDTHTVIVKRERKAWESNFEPTTWAANGWEDNAKW